MFCRKINCPTKAFKSCTIAFTLEPANSSTGPSFAESVPTLKNELVEWVLTRALESTIALQTQNSTPEEQAVADTGDGGRGEKRAKEGA
jgi:hypothetical protein